MEVGDSVTWQGFPCWIIGFTEHGNVKVRMKGSFPYALAKSRGFIDRKKKRKKRLSVPMSEVVISA